MQLIHRVAWLVALLNAVLYLFYSISMLADKAGPPVGDESMSRGMILLACFLVSSLPFAGLWIGQRFNLVQMNDGYHKGSELFFSILILVFTIVALRMYYLQFLPAL